VNTVFNWEEIYSSANATIIENLLDREIVPFCEIVNIFFPNDAEKSTDTYLINLIRPWQWIDIPLRHSGSFEFPLCFFTKEYFYLLFCWILQTYYPNLDEYPIKVDANKILALMIREGGLPVELCRLPRLNKDVRGFHIIPDYYDLDYATSDIDKITQHPVNYSGTLPLTLTYLEVIKLLEKHGHPISLLKNHVLQEAIGVYIQVEERSIINDIQTRRFSNQSIEIFRELNCGNPLYTKRYKGLERLKQTDAVTLFDGRPIFIKDNGKYDLRNYFDVQTTDLETKYHMQRHVTSCVQIEENGDRKTSNEIRLKDTLYLSDDINAIILCEQQSRKETNEDIYNILLKPDEVILLSQKIENDSPARINEQVNFYLSFLKNKHPKKSIVKVRVTEMVHRLEGPIYQHLKKTQPELRSYKSYAQPKNKK
jgi:hypothetical protein